MNASSRMLCLRLFFSYPVCVGCHQSNKLLQAKEEDDGNSSETNVDGISGGTIFPEEAKP